ncbi:stress enhanced protein 1 [Striga asiatica]|uniref:Stress enhanced protein 1 n=1 Tax=Striga asiatica TaxID=4170 RepID=A0A5A7QIZ8_STRAF|nr:stress enhanced protein 1 [Striga asiatica]
MAAVSLISPTLCCYSSFRDVRLSGAAKIASSSRSLRTLFATGSPLLIDRPIYQKKTARYSKLVSIRCEQSSKKGNGLDIWLGRLAMIGFAAAISVEIGTGKGLLENFGFTSPLPTVALAVTALVGVLTAVFIFQSASKN